MGWPAQFTHIGKIPACAVKKFAKDNNRHTETVRVFLEAGVPHDEIITGNHPNGAKTCVNMTPNRKTRKLLEEWVAKQKYWEL